jgi:hypothetical protein
VFDNGGKTAEQIAEELEVGRAMRALNDSVVG